MAYTPEMEDYLAFMQWFQDSHPEIYEIYWQSITISKSGTGVQVNRSRIDQEAYLQLIILTKEYYRNR